MAKIGDNILELAETAKIFEMGPKGPEPRSIADLFEGKTIALFAVPGAFTPTCSARHLPGYEEQADALKAKGIDEIICVSVNDPFVMGAWGESQNIQNVRLISDGNGDFTKAIDLVMDGSGFGLGIRSQRYAMLVRNGVIESLNVEAPGDFSVSAADHLLGLL